MNNLFRGEPFLRSMFVRWKFSRVGKRFRLLQPKLIVNGQYITVGDHFWAWPGLHITALDRYNKQAFTPSIAIGDHVNFLFDVHITAINRVEIHDHVLIASRVFITDHQHGCYSGERQDSPNLPPIVRDLYSAGSVVIERNCWIGEGAAILPNVRIGFGSIIGSNSVVTKSIPSMSIAVGAPARVIKVYNHEINKWVAYVENDDSTNKSK